MTDADDEERLLTAFRTAKRLQLVASEALAFAGFKALPDGPGRFERAVHRLAAAGALIVGQVPCGDWRLPVVQVAQVPKA